jgi:hypothetical protein
VLVVAIAVTGVLLSRPRAATAPAPGSTVASTVATLTSQWTGLEWHDITESAGALIGPRPSLEGIGQDPIVAWRGGLALVRGRDLTLWTSGDGLTWKQATGTPQIGAIVSVNGKLLLGGEIYPSGPALWASADAETWQTVPIPFKWVGCQRAACTSLAANSRGVVAVAWPGFDPKTVVDPSSLYFSSDGTTWTRATLPEQAYEVAVHSFLGGFAAIGMVPESGDPNTLHQRAWRSSDGLTWTRFEPRMPQPFTADDLWHGWHDLQEWDMQFGRLGADNGGFHSSDGAAWMLDSESREWWGGGQAVSDGNRIVVTQKWVCRFFVGEGDGRWRELEQGGDIGMLPGGGYAFLIPGGLLWLAGDRVYFGRALSGVAPLGSIALPTPTPTPWPGSS